jgi:hypothetical protein
MVKQGFVLKAKDCSKMKQAGKGNTMFILMSQKGCCRVYNKV